METTKKTGDIGELIAIKYLQNIGYKLLDTNYKFGRFGEVDLILKKDNLTVFIEVKYRSSGKFGIGEEGITRNKLRKFKKTVESYCFMHKINFEYIRFDVITIMKEEVSHKLKHYKNLEI